MATQRDSITPRGRLSRLFIAAVDFILCNLGLDTVCVVAMLVLIFLVIFDGSREESKLMDACVKDGYSEFECNQMLRCSRNPRDFR